jgi:hypothetical protein
VGVVVRVDSREVPRGHEVVELSLADGRRVRASAGHPTADGRSFGALVMGERLDGASIVGVHRVALADERTYDLLPSGETGAYWADGVLVGSTLAP